MSDDSKLFEEGDLSATDMAIAACRLKDMEEAYRAIPQMRLMGEGFPHRDGERDGLCMMCGRAILIPPEIQKLMAAHAEVKPVCIVCAVYVKQLADQNRGNDAVKMMHLIDDDGTKSEINAPEEEW